jgi:hypothetical protein
MDNFLVQFEEQKVPLVHKAKELVISDDQSLMLANDILQSAKNLKKALENEQDKKTRPLNDQKQAIIDSFKPYKIEIEALIKVLSEQKIIPYQMALKKQIEDYKREEAERLRKEHEKVAAEGKIVEAISIENQLNVVEEIKADNKITSMYSKSSINMVWTHEIIEPSVIPNEYLMPDEKKIKEAIKKGVRDIKGVRIFEKPSLRNVNA